MQERWLMYRAAVEDSRLESMDFYHQHIATLPPYLILDVGQHTRRLMCLFGPDTEYVLSRTVEAIMDRVPVNVAVSRMVQELINAFMETGKYHRPQLFDLMITVEQVALDIQQYVQEHHLYVRGRYLPYHYETTGADGSVVLKRLDTFEEFCDASVMSELVMDQSTLTECEVTFDYALFEQNTTTI